MEKSKKVKITLGLFYLLVVSSFLYFFLSKFTFEELTSYEFIKNNRDYFFGLKQTNLFLLSVIFIFLTIVWVLMAGFGSPVALLAGFIFGKWLGTIILVLGLSVGATILYIFGNYFLKEVIKEKFLDRFKNLEIKFKKSEFIFLLVYRFVGGIPFAIANVLPCLFNVKIFNFFWSTLIGIIPSSFLIVSIGSGLEKIINQNLEAPRLLEIIYSPDIYMPMIAFAALIIITIVTRKIFYKK
ncbi:DedA family protein [Candidatus Pelagibacter giovannonii]|uniref:TVP38/TMEM64 family membrane protein n=1 Tax=Candidatus Pelagibacter giovannonii TaxID=2563896 RepID=A0A6H1Q493_9PROT|nr:VTT domain-containing protein [Candidatus Pelagibacter giovannonii]QIZ20929.1 DedA family protein [Candidatus Pelagibacter giovannonii]